MDNNIEDNIKDMLDNFQEEYAQKIASAMTDKFSIKTKHRCPNCMGVVWWEEAAYYCLNCNKDITDKEVL